MRAAAARSLLSGAVAELRRAFTSGAVLRHRAADAEDSNGKSFSTDI
jgi:hypothetical protein